MTLLGVTDLILTIKIKMLLTSTQYELRSERSFFREMLLKTYDYKVVWNVNWHSIIYIYLKRKINLRNFSFELLLLHIKYYLPPGQNLK